MFLFNRESSSTMAAPSHPSVVGATATLVFGLVFVASTIVTSTVLKPLTVAKTVARKLPEPDDPVHQHSRTCRAVQ